MLILFLSVLENDIDNILKIRDKFKKLDINCYPIFAKTASSFTPAEISLFKQYSKSYVPFILLANPELEAEFLFYGDSDEGIPCKHPMLFEHLVQNTEYLYLR